MGAALPRSFGRDGQAQMGDEYKFVSFSRRQSLEELARLVSERFACCPHTCAHTHADVTVSLPEGRVHSLVSRPRRKRPNSETSEEPGQRRPRPAAPRDRPELATGAEPSSSSTATVRPASISCAASAGRRCAASGVIDAAAPPSIDVD